MTVSCTSSNLTTTLGIKLVQIPPIQHTPGDVTTHQETGSTFYPLSHQCHSHRLFSPLAMRPAIHFGSCLSPTHRNDRSISYRPESPSPSVRHHPSDKLRIKLNQSLEGSIPLEHCHIPALGKLQSSEHLETGGSNGNWFVSLTTAAAPATTPKPPGMMQKGAHSPGYRLLGPTEPASELSLVRKKKHPLPNCGHWVSLTEKMGYLPESHSVRQPQYTGWTFSKKNRDKYRKEPK